MPLSPSQFAELRNLQRLVSDWFSIDEIRKRDPELEASHFIHRGSGQELAVPHMPQDVYQKLDKWAADLLEQEVRLYEKRISDLYNEQAVAPTPDDDCSVVEMMVDYINATEQAIKAEIAEFSHHQEEEWERSWSKLSKSAKRLRTEVSDTLRLNGELIRLELNDSGFEPIDRIGFAQTKIERFLGHFRQISHPFSKTGNLTLLDADLKRSIRLIIYVVFHPVAEPRLSGYENKFATAFLRYLTCPRDVSSSPVEQVATLFEPFLKKLAYLFDLRGATGRPFWGSGLSDLVSEMQLTRTDLKNSDETYWASQSVEDAVIRVAYQLRQKSAHEAHDYPYFERERNAYFIFAALVTICLAMLRTTPKISDAISHQAHVDLVRDLLVKIDELVEGPYGPRVDATPRARQSRLDKLLAFAARAQPLWPTCSVTLAQLLENEYLSIKDELIEEDRGADIESYLEDMRGSQY